MPKQQRCQAIKYEIQALVWQASQIKKKELPGVKFV